MPTFKVTFAERWRQNGCSFSLFQTGGTYQTVEDLAVKLAKKVLVTLGAGVEIPYIRVSDESLRGDAEVFDVGLYNAAKGSTNLTPTGNQSVVTASAAAPNDPISCIMLTLTAATRAKGRIFLRWYPDPVAENGLWAPTNSVGDAMQDFIKTLVDDKWGFMAITPGAVRYPITKIEAVGTSTDRLTVTAAGHTFVPGDSVRIGKVQGTNASLVNRQWKVGAVAGATFTLANSLPAHTGGFAYNVGGEAWKTTKIFQQIAEVAIRGDIKGRRPGRPFGSLVGRRSARRK